MGLVLKKRKLGKTDLDFSILGLGTVKFGRNTDVKYPHSFDIPSDNEILKLLQKAHCIGINYLDTAPAYGNSEKKIGKLLKKLKKKFYIVSKVGENYDPLNGSHFNFKLNEMRASIEKSIINMQLNYLDVALLHLGDDEINQIKSGAIENLKKIKQEGLVNYIGISGKSLKAGKLALEIGIDVLMISYNPQYTDEYPLIEEANKKSTGIIIKKAFNSGYLIKNSNDISNTLSKVFSNQNISSVVIGTKNIKHLEQNFKSLENKYLERKENGKF